MYSILMVQDIIHASDIMREIHGLFVINDGQDETHFRHSEIKALNMISTSITN